MPVPAGGGDDTDLYTTVAKVKNSLGKTSEDDRDDLVEDAVRAACRRIDLRCGRRFYDDSTATTRTYRVDGDALTKDGEQVLTIHDVASLTDLAVTTSTDRVLWTTTTEVYETSPDAAIADGKPVTALIGTAGWLPAGGRVRVTARWGWPAVPDDIAEAAKLLAARLYRRKDSPQGVMGSAEWGAIRVSRLDPDIEALLAPFDRFA